MTSDAELLAELQQNFDYPLCGKIVQDSNSGETFCTLREGHEGDCGGAE
jgi:hypothetical protein